jgi:hypothetical protein
VFPGITASDDRDTVRGVVYLDVDPSSLARLDVFEDDFYRRETVWVGGLATFIARFEGFTRLADGPGPSTD